MGECDLHNDCHFCGVFHKEILELSLWVINRYKADAAPGLLH